MTSTTMSPTAVAPGRLAQGYRWEDETWKLEPQLPDGAFGPMGGMLTSPRDLATWVAQFLAAFPARDEPEAGPVRRASLREMQQVARPRPAAVTRAADGALQLSAGGYGFGLGISGNCRFAHVVAHTGGLPGFGSLMLWLPEYGVGIIALGNRTYAGWGGVTQEALGLLQGTGALVPREPQPAPVLEVRRDQVTRLALRWDDALADSLAAMNLFRDRSRERRRVELAQLADSLGGCRAAPRFDAVENALRGRWTMPCARGGLQVAITLAPTMPPMVQHLEATAVAAAEPARPAGSSCPAP
jgi:CubicO group peptidase (beta-lactamase class C family)